MLPLILVQDRPTPYWPPLLVFLLSVEEELSILARTGVEFSPKSLVKKLCFCAATGLGSDTPTHYGPSLLVFLLSEVEELSMLAGRGVEFSPKSVAFCSSFLLHLFSGFNLHNWSNEWAKVNSRCITRVGSGWLE